MTVRIDLNGLLARAASADGLEPADLDALAPALLRVREESHHRRARGGLPFADLPFARETVAEVTAAAREIAEDFDMLVVLGSGGSAQSGRALVDALGGGAGLHVAVSDSIDPAELHGLLVGLDLRRTCFNVVSKSGDTAETMARFLIVRDRLLRELGAVDYKRHVVVTTDAQRGALRQIVNDEGFRALAVPAELDARFCLLAAPGLFPAACAGIDVEELLAGAACADERMQEAEGVLADPVLALAGALHALASRGKRILVTMPYADRLAALGDWFCECWNESLGKTTDRAGHPLVAGCTAVGARGSADQHAHLRCHLEGPPDRAVLFLRVEDHGESLDIPAAYQDLDAVGCLGGHALGALLNGQQQAAELTLARRGRPSAAAVLPALNAFTVGQLAHLLAWTTVAAAFLAELEPFGQPAVDDVQQYTFGLLGRPGFEARRHELEAWVAGKDPRFVL